MVLMLDVPVPVAPTAERLIQHMCAHPEEATPPPPRHRSAGLRRDGLTYRCPRAQAASSTASACRSNCVARANSAASGRETDRGELAAVAADEVDLASPSGAATAACATDRTVDDQLGQLHRYLRALADGLGPRPGLLIQASE